MSENVYTEIHDVDGDVMEVTTWATTSARGIIASTDSGVMDLDREGAVHLIEALTAAIEAADAREAKEAAKLKRGDKVSYRGVPASTRTVMSDEDDRGRVDVVITGGEMPQFIGDVLTDCRARDYVRV
ncbi:hypothetical protein HPO96_37180 [Kribbella sandramycini]|uniref:Uncharacterized protein n=1 Tax=Kribbella sandramycini TaxID=60450 RepID=A0A7Y4L7M4_9ACTN|nr:hypothetical protein [Kribbella sandramycini]MBB6564436.1 hypothetical protein [Kribbella sandramycini]NOL45894.1 hypothetical protein [Kribbella sandramycini]